MIKIVKWYKMVCNKCKLELANQAWGSVNNEFSTKEELETQRKNYCWITRKIECESTENKYPFNTKKVTEYIHYCPVCAYELGLIKKIPDKYMDMIKRSSLCDTLMRRIKRIERNKCK